MLYSMIHDYYAQWIFCSLFATAVVEMRQTKDLLELLLQMSLMYRPLILNKCGV